MKCGTLDTGEFVKGFCQHRGKIEYWDKIDGRHRFGKVVHHANGDHEDNRPENRMACHASCHRISHRYDPHIDTILISISKTTMKKIRTLQGMGSLPSYTDNHIIRILLTHYEKVLEEMNDGKKYLKNKRNNERRKRDRLKKHRLSCENASKLEGLPNQFFNLQFTPDGRWVRKNPSPKKNS